MMKKLLSLLLALVMCLGLLPGTASAADANLPDWYFLFAIFKNVDADYNQDGVKKHTKYTMTQDEIDFVREDAQAFEEYMNQVGVMRAHVDVVEIDASVTELKDYGTAGGYISVDQAAPLLEGKVDLDQYDHVTCVTSLNASMGYLGLGGTSYANGTGHTCINLQNQRYCLNTLRVSERAFPPSMYVHEFLHFMENMDKKWGAEFGLHDIRINFYTPDNDNGRECYTDIILNRARGNAGTGVHPAVWQYPPHVLRTIRELTIPYGVVTIVTGAFKDSATLTKATIPGSVASIEYNAFRNCTSLAEVTMNPGVSSIGMWVFGNCTALTRVTIPASVTSIDYAAFWNTGITDVYYGGTKAQWEALQSQTGAYNEPLTKANIHCLSEGTLGDHGELDWSYDPSAGQVTVTGGAVSVAEPAYAAVYGEGGRMTGITAITASGGEAAVGNGFGCVKLIWVDGNAAPKCACVEISE